MTMWILDVGMTYASRLVDLDGDLPPAMLVGDMAAQARAVKEMVGEDPVAMDFTGAGYVMAQALLYQQGVAVQQITMGQMIQPPTPA